MHRTVIPLLFPLTIASSPAGVLFHLSKVIFSRPFASCQKILMISFRKKIQSMNKNRANFRTVFSPDLTFFPLSSTRAAYIVPPKICHLFCRHSPSSDLFPLLHREFFPSLFLPLAPRPKTEHIHHLLKQSSERTQNATRRIHSRRLSHANGVPPA